MNFRIMPAACVRSCIARAILEDRASHIRIDKIDLMPHQTEAVSIARRSLDEFGGVLLADPVGTGKTFVALAIANANDSAVIVGPAVLRSMWEGAASRCRISIRYISFESLSRSVPHEISAELVIIDEAHHARNVGTQRYARLAHLVSGKNVVLISATPIHNCREDLISLLSLFMGSRAASLSDAELARIVVRRAALSSAVEGIPTVKDLTWIGIDVDETIPGILLDLPPPLPPSDGGDGGALVVHSLVRQWISSDAALIGALKRRLVRAEALIAALENDTWPSSGELGSWISGDDTVQLGFPGFLAASTSRTRELLPIVECHRAALVSVLRIVRHASSDAARANAIRQIMVQHPGIKIVGFSQYADTVDGLFPLLSSYGRVAALTGTGAKVSGGRVSRADVLERFAPLAMHAKPARGAEEIDLLLTTDLLSEGINLQDAGVVIHLDFPWTPARMEQRVGRLARIGSIHREVRSFAFRPPASAEAVVRIEKILTEKMRAAGIVTERIASLTVFDTDDTRANNPALLREAIRTRARMWLADASPRCSGGCVVTGITADDAGFLALMEMKRHFILIAERSGSISDDPAVILECMNRCVGGERSPGHDEAPNAVARISSWMEGNGALAVIQSASRHRDFKRHLLKRIEHVVRRSARHSRPVVAARASVAHSILLSQLDAHTERELEALSAASDSDLIGRIIERGSSRRSIDQRYDASPRAIILFGR